jgi:hypothetical protein
MTSVPGYIKPLFRIISMILIVVSGLITIIASSGGGGGGDDDDDTMTDDPAPSMPSKVNYNIGSPDGDPSTSGLTYTIESGTEPATVSVAFSLRGSYTPSERSYTLDASPIARMQVTTNNLRFDLLWDSFDLRVQETLQWRYGEYPTAGEFRAATGNFVSVTVNNNVNGSGMAGVDLQLVEFEVPTASAGLTWAEFEAVLDDPASAPLYQVQAAFTFTIIRAVYQQIQFIMDSFDTIRTQENALEAAGSGTEFRFSCDPFDSVTGTYQFTWYDGPGEFTNAVGSGDDFTTGFTQCWLDDAALNSDLLYVSGAIALNGYGESGNPFSLGFNDVVVNDLVVTETEGAADSVTLGTTMTVNSFGGGERDGIFVELFPDTSGIINMNNVFSIASVGANAVTLPIEYGEFFIDLLVDIAAGPASSGTVNCPVSGEIDFVMDNFPIVNNTNIDFTFNDCVQGTVDDPVTVTGSATMTVNSLTGTLSADVYTTDTALAFDDIGILDDVGLVTVNGGMNFSRQANSGDFVEVASDANPLILTVSEAGNTTTLTAFSINANRTLSGINLGSAGNSITMLYSEISDPLVISILAQLQGTDFPAMYSGSFRITASDNSTLTVGIGTSETLLTLDSNGDGTADNTLITQWDDIR